MDTKAVQEELQALLDELDESIRKLVVRRNAVDEALKDIRR